MRKASRVKERDVRDDMQSWSGWRISRYDTEYSSPEHPLEVHNEEVRTSACEVSRVTELDCSHETARGLVSQNLRKHVRRQDGQKISET